MPVNYDDKGEKVIRPDRQYQFTKEQLTHYVSCARSVEYFAKNAVKVVHPKKGIIPMEPRDYQMRMLEALKNDRVSILAPRQCGKCCFSDTYVTIRNKNTGETKEVTILEFYKIAEQSASELL
jgi:hypothetical protein